MNTILNEPNHRRVSSDRLNSDVNQLAESLESESSLTPSEKILPHSYPKAREGARDTISLLMSTGIRNVPAEKKQ